MATKKSTAKKSKPKKPAAPKPPGFKNDDQVVFAFRLTRAERDLIHRAAGSGKASSFVRQLAVEAATNDMATLKKAATAAPGNRP